MSTQGTVTASTDAGMLALWCASTFEGVDDYNAWESRVEDRIDEAIADGEFVPVKHQVRRCVRGARDGGPEWS